MFRLRLIVQVSVRNRVCWGSSWQRQIQLGNYVGERGVLPRIIRNVQAIKESQRRNWDLGLGLTKRHVYSMGTQF